MTARPGKNAPTAAGPNTTLWIIALTVAGFDQVLKAAVVRALAPETSLTIIPGVLSLTHVRNTGIAFGLFAGLPAAITVAAALTLVAMLFYNEARSAPGRAARLGVGLMLGGALGNLVDRIRLGFVVDYLDFHVWPVFNLADAAVVTGSLLLGLALVRRARTPELKDTGES